MIIKIYSIEKQQQLVARLIIEKFTKGKKSIIYQQFDGHLFNDSFSFIQSINDDDNQTILHKSLIKD